MMNILIRVEIVCLAVLGGACLAANWQLLMACNRKLVVEFERKTLFSNIRLSFYKLEKGVKGAR